MRVVRKTWGGYTDIFMGNKRDKSILVVSFPVASSIIPQVGITLTAGEEKNSNCIHSKQKTKGERAAT